MTDQFGEACKLVARSGRAYRGDEEIFPPGMIGVPCSRSGQDSDFLPSIMRLQKPAGTVFTKAVGLGPAAPLNDIARQFMAHPELRWLFLTNDDNLCPADTIPRLLRHHLPAVTGLYFSRLMPFEPVAFDQMKEGVDLIADYPEAKRGDRWYYRKLMQTGDSGLQQLLACGDGCLMVQREVMEAIGDPWWEYGETLADACDHDVVFSRKIREAGFKIWCDTDLWVDHITSMIVRPYRDKEGNWFTQLVQADRLVQLPAAKVGLGG